MRVALLGKGRVLDTVEAECRQRGWTVALRTDQPTTPTNLGQADVGFASRYRHLLTPEHLSACPVLNIHPSYLPWNRGAYPNVWPLIDGSPAGVTIHWMDAGVDTGPIVSQSTVMVRDTDTAGTLYERLEDVAQGLVQVLFVSYDRDGHWPPSFPQDGTGTRHYAWELAALDVPPGRYDGDSPFFRYEEEESFTASELFAKLRARTFPGYPGLRIGNVRATITLTPVEE